MTAMHSIFFALDVVALLLLVATVLMWLVLIEHMNANAEPLPYPKPANGLSYRPAPAATGLDVAAGNKFAEPSVLR